MYWVTMGITDSSKMNTFQYPAVQIRDRSALAEMELRDELPKTPVGKLSKKELVEEERAKRAPAQ